MYHSIRQYIAARTTDMEQIKLNKTSFGLLVINLTCTCLPFTILVLRRNLRHNRLLISTRVAISLLEEAHKSPYISIQTCMFLFTMRHHVM